MLHWLDRLTEPIAPRWTLRRVRARMAVELALRHYEAAASSRRTEGWRRTSGDGNAAVGQGLHRTRDVARDLVRNNPYAASAVATICDHAVGWGITTEPEHAKAAALWQAWAETPACDADGRQDLSGLAKQVVETTVVAGECLVRRRWRRPEDGLPIPLQLQVLEPDFLDTARDGISTADGGLIIQGIEHDPIGRRRSYWLFREHPGARGLLRGGFRDSRPIPATEICHVFKPGRPGQVRAPSWLAPIVLRLKDFDDYEDAALMKQKVAACLAVLTTDLDGTAPPLGEVKPSAPLVDMLEPGMIGNMPPGREVHVVQPPQISEHAEYTRTVLRAIAAGIGVTYEDLVGDFQGLPFSAARMSRIRHWARVEDWRWRMLIPQLFDPVWGWFLEAARLVADVPATLAAEWTTQPMPMIEPDKEGQANTRLIRSSMISLPEALRERGYRSKRVLEEIAKSNQALDALGIISDADPRKTTQQGQLQAPPKPAATAPTPPPLAAPKAADGGAGAAGRSWVADTVIGALAVAQEAIAVAQTRASQNGHTAIAPSPVVFEQGAIQTHVTAPPGAPAPNVSVGGPTVHVAPPAVSVPVRIEAPVTISEGAVCVQTPVTIEEGAVRVGIEAPPPASVHVDGPQVNVAPPTVTIADGAVRVDAPVTIADGAVRVDVAAPSPADVRVEGAQIHVTPPAVTIAEGAVRVEAPVTVAVPPPPRQRGMRVRKRVLKGPDGGIQGTEETHTPIEPGDEPAE